MKTILSLILSMLLVITAGAQTTDYISKQDFQAEKKKLNEGIFAAKKTGLEAKKSLTQQDQKIDSLVRLIEVNRLMLAASNDSISKMNLQVSDLQNQVNQKKTTLRTGLILAFIILFILIIISLIWIFMVKKKMEENFRVLTESNEKTGVKIDEGFKATEEKVKSFSDEISQKVSSGLSQIDMRAANLEQQMKTQAVALDEKLGKSKEENELLIKKEDEKLNMLQSLIDKNARELTDRLNSLEKNQKELESGFIEKVNALKIQVEQKIQSVSAEISKLRK
jgi:hypothetical protein